MTSWTDRLAHKLPSAEKFRKAAEELDTPLLVPQGREEALHDAGGVYRDAAFELGSELLYMKRRFGTSDPSAIIEQRELENKLKAMCSPWVDRARETGGL